MRLPSLPAILLAGLTLRLIWAALVPVAPVSDAAAYHLLATNIVQHGVYGFAPDQPGAYWAVGTAAIYAAVYAAFGVGSSTGIVVVNMASSLAAIWLLHDLGRRWYGPHAGRAAALVFALWPLMIQYVTLVASELHFVALSLAALACWERAGATARGMAFLALAGLLLAAATYVRPIALLIPAALAIAAVLRGPRAAGGPILAAVATTAMIVALVAPWTARNERVFGERVFLSTNFWPNFWMGNRADGDGVYAPLPSSVEGLDEPARARALRAMVLADVRADPGGFAWRTVGKAVRLHDRETVGVVWNQAGIERLGGPRAVLALKLISTLYWYAAVALALAGIVLAARRDGAWRTLISTPVWLWLYVTAVHAVIVVGDRYHVPANPMIALLAGLALASFGRRRSGDGADPVA